MRTAVEWYAVRCVFRDTRSPTFYEERLTLWRADSFESAIEKAEAEARDYAAVLSLRYLGLAQAYKLTDEPGEGVEVFSLYRESDLGAEEYLSAFFDTGTERQRHVGDPEALPRDLHEPENRQPDHGVAADEDS